MSSKKKKVVTKDELRRLMKSTKASVKGKSDRINHPLAKYNALDQLVCVLCNSVIKSDVLWMPHIASKQHKERLDVVKTAGPIKPPEFSQKRKAAETHVQSGASKKLRENGNQNHSSGLPTDFFDTNTSSKQSSVSSSTNKLGLGSYSSSEEEEEEEKPLASSLTSSMQSSVQLSHPALPPDFFDSGVKKDEPEIVEEKSKTMADVLPEGFFDNPETDAKVRQVEYKDKMEEEWEMFQRAMKEESHVSEAIMEEEDEQINVDRNLDEIDDQMNRWKEINTLEIKKEEIMHKKTDKSQKNKEESDDELEEEDLEDFLNWRSKKLK